MILLSRDPSNLLPTFPYRQGLTVITIHNNGHNEHKFSYGATHFAQRTRSYVSTIACMLARTPLLLHLVEGQPVPVDWPKKVGYPPPGMIRKTSYPAGSGKGPGIPEADDEYPCTKEGKKLAKAQAWMFPSKRVKVCGKVLKV